MTFCLISNIVTHFMLKVFKMFIVLSKAINVFFPFFCLAHLRKPLSMCIISTGLKMDYTVACLSTISAVYHLKPLPSPLMSL